MPAPANDNFANATALSTTLPGNLTGETNVDASTSFETNEPLFGAAGFSGADGAQSVWYSFTPTSTARYRFIVSGLANGWNSIRAVEFDLFSGSTLSTLTPIRMSARTSPNTPNYAYDFWMVAEALLTSGVTYYLRVASPWYTGDGTNPRTVNFDLDWLSLGNPSAPSNDDLANATDLGTDPANGSVATVSTIGATDEASFSYGDQTPVVWYKFHCATTESQDIHLIRDGADPYYIPYWDIYKKLSVGTPTSWADLDWITGSDLGAGSPYDDVEDANAVASLVAGNDYYIAVGNWLNDGTEGGGNLYFGTPPSAPANDDRTSLNSAPLQWNWPWYLGRTEWASYPSNWWTQAQAGHADGTTVAATPDSGESAHAGYGPTRSVWYVLDITRAGNYKIWVESSVDCVLAVYNKNNSPNLGSLVAEDDDSGAGNWPEVTVGLATGDYWIVVDSKTEGTFRLKWEKVRTGTRPANDDFANATNIASVPYSSSGTTIDATAEADEHDCFMLGGGPKDTVWYKFVASGNGTLKIKATVQSTNGGPDSGQTAVGVDLWHGTTLANLVRHPEPPTIDKGYFNHFDTAAELEDQAMYLDYVNGETYYIRVQTPGGGSEDFTLFVETLAVYLDLKVSGQDVGPFTDSATIYLDLNVSATEVFHQVVTSDSATVAFDLQASGVDLKGFEYTDATSVYLDLQGFAEQDCYFHLEPSFSADGVRKWAANGVRRWSVGGTRRWTWTEGEGLPQVC